MPLYEYICTTCGHEFEERMSFSQTNEQPECPRCASGETRKKLSLFAASTPSSNSSSSTSCGGGHGGFT
ncbi:MAG: zinc ribbon domain-containing protein [Anaerolineaceae bacterium]|nr:zinc ribbon domain-containing protein [Anaerolineaceae bacterium]